MDVRDVPDGVEGRFESRGVETVVRAEVAEGYVGDIVGAGEVTAVTAPGETVLDEDVMGAVVDCTEGSISIALMTTVPVDLPATASSPLYMVLFQK